MKNIITLFLVGFFSIFNAQNQKFIYEFSYVTDSTKRDEVKTELMNLDVTPEGSKFYSYIKIPNRFYHACRYQKTIARYKW